MYFVAGSVENKLEDKKLDATNVGIWSVSVVKA